MDAPVIKHCKTVRTFQRYSIIWSAGCLLAGLILVSCGPSTTVSNVDTPEILKGLDQASGSPARVRAEERLKKMGSAAVPSLLLELQNIGRLLKSGDPLLSQRGMERRLALWNAFHVLGTNMEPYAVDFQRELQDGDNPGDAAQALTYMTHPYAVHVCEALTNRSLGPRFAAVGAMDRLRELRSNWPIISNSIPSMALLLKDPDPSLRNVTANTLGRLQIAPETCLPALFSCVQSDNDWMVRVVAAGAMGRFGTNAASYLDKLREVEKAEVNAKVKHALLTAIASIAADGSRRQAISSRPEDPFHRRYPGTSSERGVP